MPTESTHQTAVGSPQNNILSAISVCILQGYTPRFLNYKNKHMKLKIIILSFILSLSFYTDACTTAVISGKYTKDGRPLLWKNRDTWAINNIIRFFDDGKYACIGLVNSKDLKGKSIWIGYNETGFAIMNSASYNLNIGDGIKQTGHEGQLMKKALQNCKTLADFEAMLDSIPKPTRLEANFGVIDGNGGAAYYELNNKGYVKFNANDPKVAPFGYIIRTNYSHTGKLGTESSGYIRYNTANELFYNAVSTNTMDAQFISRKVSRTLYHSLIKEDLYQKYGNRPANTPAFAAFGDYIPRTGSSSSVVIQGVKKNENPDNTMMWATVGFPLTSIAIPVWIKTKNKFPDILKYNKKIEDSPICNAALTLKKQCFPIRWGKYERRYLNVNAISNAEGTGITQIIKPYENKIFSKGNRLIDEMRNNTVSKSKIEDYYTWVNAYVKKMYKKEFNLDL